ncbi:aconitate hydratase A [Trichonephila clavata]|uniref:Aconitate hydratase A n=1 Tax=Trichonephila clavata TaxID=2740835 RepID=A0A8X6HN42_TRICU|nr:aconitate hydratase A [Trichonephila clavata]
MRGTFANIRIKNEMVSIEGGYTNIFLLKKLCRFLMQQCATKKVMFLSSLWQERSMAQVQVGIGQQKVLYCLGIKVVIAESFERIHRANLIGMGILPLIFQNGITRKIFDGSEIISIKGEIVPSGNLECIIKRKDSSEQSIQLQMLCTNCN